MHELIQLFMEHQGFEVHQKAQKYVSKLPGVHAVEHTYQPHNLLVLNLFALVHILPCKGWVLLRVAGRQGVDAHQDTPHEVCIMGQSIDSIFYSSRDCAVATYCLLKASKLLC